MKKIFAILVGTVLVGCTSVDKPYVEDLTLQKKAFIQIDGSSSKGQIPLFSPKRNTFLGMHRYKGNCEWDYLGSIFTKANNNSPKLVIPVGAPIKFTVIRVTNSSNQYSSYRKSDSQKSYFIPKPNASYSFKYSDIEKNLVDFNVYETIGGNKPRLVKSLPEPNCKKLRS